MADWGVFNNPSDNIEDVRQGGRLPSVPDNFTYPKVEERMRSEPPGWAQSPLRRTWAYWMQNFSGPTASPTAPMRLTPDTPVQNDALVKALWGNQ